MNPTMKFIRYVLFLPATLWLIGATEIDGPTDDEVNVTYYGDDYLTVDEESGNATSDWWDDFSNVVVEGVSDADVREDNSLSTELDCWSGLRKFDPNFQKKVYRVGVHATRGVETAWKEYNRTFSTYLSVTAGRRFVPPIEFQMVPVSYKELFDKLEGEELDFFFANPSIFSCVGSEMGAQSLATVVSRLEVRGHEYDLDVYGGVIATRADRYDINAIHDLQDKVIGAGSTSDLMAGQLQFYEMQKAGMSPFMDPKQVVFTRDGVDVVKGVLNGDFDVGFFRADQVDRMQDENGIPINPELFKVISPRTYILDDGNMYPFMHSTDIYPEWPLAALEHVNSEVSEEVQNALLAIGKHAQLGKALNECEEVHNKTFCNDDTLMPFPDSLDPEESARCDTTRALAKFARECSQFGNFTAFRPTRSYAEPRTMLQAAGFMQQDERGNWQCARVDDLYDNIICPEGHFKRSEREFELTCKEAGLECKEGYECYCKPCLEAFEVEVYPHVEGELDKRVEVYTGAISSACKKMSLCGTLAQNERIAFRAFDNLRREGANFTAIIHSSDATETFQMRHVNGTWAYQFDWTNNRVGTAIMEIFVDDVQIPQSPSRIQIVERDCSEDYEGENRVPDDYGVCVCGSGAYEIASNCVSKAVFFAVLCVVLVLIALQIGLIVLLQKRKQNDQLWHVNVEELHFDDPIEVIGQGAFGVVLKAEYRGTQVAIKRVLPVGKRNKVGRNASANSARGKSASMGSVSFSCGSVGRGCGKGAEGISDNVSTGTEMEKSSLVEQEDVEAQLSKEESASMESKSMESKSTTSLAASTDFDFLDNMRKPQSKWFSRSKQVSEDSRFLTSAFSSAASNSKGAWYSVFCLDENRRHRNDFLKEMRLLSRLRHPCITTVMGAVVTNTHDPMMVLEYMEYGSLHDLLRNETMHTGGDVILQICRDISQGLRYLHESKPPIVHGDLKARNILIDSRFRAKVCDFGLSIKKKNGLSGTPYWMAPEYLLGKSEYNTCCDIYSFGMIMFEIYARKGPYAGENPRQVLRKVCDPRVNKRPVIPECCQPKIVDIMKKCWSVHPDYRPSAKELDLSFMDMDAAHAEPALKRDLKAAEKASADMIYRVFPKHIADALKAGEKVEPEQHEIVTVFFSDIVHFTDISASLSAIKVSRLLDRLYLAFDTLAEKHKVFKVETIGDAYMGVTNLLGNQNDCHVKQIAEFAIDIVEEAGKIMVDEDDPKKGYIRVRVGFHSGPVVSNVIGFLNPRYGLFGDTVNTASRMESNSMKGKIQCSDKSAKLLQEQAPHIQLTKRGKIGVKGKGEMTVWFVGDNNKAKDETKEHQV